MLLDFLGASLLGNLLRAIATSQERSTIRTGQDF